MVILNEKRRYLNIKFYALVFRVGIYYHTTWGSGRKGDAKGIDRER